MELLSRYMSLSDVSSALWERKEKRFRMERLRNIVSLFRFTLR